ncbi:fibronectin type III domain-containing protein, partial [bacterium]|nr:fibronectin type III domain-containing protein [bacterium]
VGASCSLSGTCQDRVCLSEVCEGLAPATCTCTSSPVIYSVSPTGGFCEDDINVSCNRDSDCVTGDCDRNTPNGAVGNLVTIGGYYFGTAGSVEFDGIVAGDPSSANPACNAFDSWTDNQIVVVVPGGIPATSSIMVERAVDSLFDTTDNFVGPSIPGFLRNTIVRPGLCGIDPNHGQINDEITYHGLNLLGSEAYMGFYRSYVPAYDSQFASNIIGTADVPSVDVGTTTTFASSSGVYGNYLNFHKDAEPYTGPYITSFSPVLGPAGQYVTINGSGFGRFQNNSKVYFGATTSPNEADYDFPDVCADSFWSDRQIIVKVPSTTLGAKIINIDIDSWGIISTDNGRVSPSTFDLTSGIPDPGVCKISPVMGPNGIPVSLWGEYFGSATGIVRFFENHDQGAVNISFWGPEADAERVNTLVHEEAISGPVNVVRGASISNDVNFEVGFCTDAGRTQEEQDDACGPDICCPAGTYKEGRCATSTDNCYIDIPNSVFEWEFNTGFGTTTDGDGSLYDSCQERSLDIGQCTSTQMCPNTNGRCSFNSVGISSETGECGDVYCNDTQICTSSPNGCYYSNLLDNCLEDNGAGNPVICDVVSTTTDILGNTVDMYCTSEGHWHYNSNLSCASSSIFTWSMIPGGGCTDFTASGDCDSCNFGFSCIDNVGYCGLEELVCGSGSNCIGDECIVTSPASCECCCRLGNSEQDCCSFENPPGSGIIESLECMGNCGEDNAVDTDTYGYCSGCRIDLDGSTTTMTTAEINASDQACVCGDSFGQYCDYNADPDGDGEPDGVCRDCNTLPSAPLCSEHNSTCCVDAMDGNDCRGEVSEKIITATLPDYSYCGYYHCDLSGSTCATSAPSVYDLASSTIVYPNLFDATSTCVQRCVDPPGGLGESCEALDDSPVCDTGLCDTPFQCMVDSAAAPFTLIYPSDCGFCCCDPNTAGIDECVLAGLTETNCQSNQSPCSGDYRGLCCGCSEDDDCVAIGNPTSVGCGSDTCCRPRPNVTSTLPIHTAIGVCSNAQISATFDSKMKIPSFTGNFILVGEYGGACPDETVYLAQNKDNFKDRNFFVKLYYNIKLKIKHTFTSIARVFGYSAIAQTSNYCVVPGMVTGENLASGNSRLTFSPTNILDTGTTYYAIVIGDRDLDSSRGVFNYWNIGMNASSTSPITSNYSFNGVNYSNSYIWSFETMEDQGTDGVCIIDHVDIVPDSYLFKTIDNSLEEDDTDPNDDSVSSNGIDRDKVFIAEARAAEEYDNQILTPFPGIYDWAWDWSVDNSLIVATSSPALFSATNSKKLIVVQEGAVNDYTVVRAEANLITDIYSYGYVNNQGSSTVYVFLCNNPWPPFSGAGTWAPWEDNATNCVINGSGCADTNYEIYYCRDYGEEGITADDLPAIASDETLIIGSSTDKNKEFYFFRENIPDVNYITLNPSPFVSPGGGSITINWSVDALINASNTVAIYNVYYDTNSGVPYASVSSVPSTTLSATISNLTNGQEYCFSITAVYEDGGESDYSDEVCVTPNDTSASAQPTINNTIPSDREVRIAWQDNSSGNADSFKIYYKATTSCGVGVNFAGFVDVPYATNATTTITGLADGVEYCFGMVSVDEYNNESSIVYDSAMPFASPTNINFTGLGSTTIDLAWNYTDTSGGGIDYNTVYYGTSSYEYAWNVNTTNDQIQITGLATGTPYFFNVVSYDVFSHNNGYINEESITTLP